MLNHAAVLVAAVLAAASGAVALPVCEGGNRTDRRLTCVVDGDTGWEAGMKWRLTSPGTGVDAPEISRPECVSERRAGEAARDRLRELMRSGYEIAFGRLDRYGRALALVTLADGRDAGEALMAEGHAQAWPNSANPWCDG